MKLSHLLYLREQLDHHRPSEVDTEFRRLLDPFMHFAGTNSMDLPDVISELNQVYDRIFRDLVDFDQVVIAMRNRLDTMINQITPRYLQESYRLYENEMKRDPVPVILHRRPTLEQEVQDFIDGRISIHSDWRRAGMIIRPGLETWGQKLVGLDPLYLVDETRELMDPFIGKFNPKYQSRLRPYLSKENLDGLVKIDLPEGQIGYCLAYNFFHYKPLEILRNYLAEIYRLLEPGGVLHISINDCDRSGGVMLVERNFMCYTPASMVMAAAEGLGFGLVFRQHMDAANTWLEFQKPGHRRSLRGGQSMAKIVDNGSTIA